MAPSKQEKDKPIVIIGAGCFGLSTAHALSLNGYTDITVLDKDDHVPSRFSAANDLNKVIRAEYPDPFYTNLSLAAIREWKRDPLYSPHYFETGFLNVTSAAASEQTRGVVTNYYNSIRQLPAFKGKVSPVRGPEDIKLLAPGFADGSMKGWTGYFNKLAGYAHSTNALKAVYNACVRQGVKFGLGPEDGEVSTFLYDNNNNKPNGNKNATCKGVRTAGGKEYPAHKTIIAAGGNVGQLLPQISPQATGRCWGVLHIQLTPEEAESLRGIPVTNVRDLAFFFEPDRETNKLKFCHLGSGYTNTASTSIKGNNNVSIPPSSLRDSAFIPETDEIMVRKLLKEVLPGLEDRPFIDQHLCWFADANNGNSDYIIDWVPGTGGSVAVLSGDSGHGFKMLPIFGRFVLELLEGGEQGQKIEQWRWNDVDESKEKDKSDWRTGPASRELKGIARAKL